MKQVKFLFVLAILVLLFVSCSKDESVSSEFDENSKTSTEQLTGNGAPNGAHYNLNIIGVPKNKTAAMTGNNGGRIFVKLDGRSKIMLIEDTEGLGYQVLDANGTDGTASFRLPAPDPDGDGVSSYTIFARALGRGGSTTITTCAWDPEGFIEVCSADPITLDADGRPRFENVSTELLTILIDGTNDDLDGNGVTIPHGRYPIFSDEFQDYFWQYDNDGLKLLQLRFYEITSDISGNN